MTLILTLATPYYILQVSDRLVTRGRTAFDPLSNKNVLYQARDGLISIGYSGLAYLDGAPTDQWLAEKLVGQRFTERFSIRTGTSGRHLDVGQAVEAIRASCQEQFTRVPKSGLTIQQFVAAGWQWGRKVARPVLAVISNSNANLGRFEISRIPRYWHYPRQDEGLAHAQDQPATRTWSLSIHLTAIPKLHPLQRGQLRRLMTSLASVSRDADECEKLLVKAIRLAASESPFIGGDCMCLLLPPPSAGQARVRYSPATSSSWKVELGCRSVTTPTAYSPWIVGPSIVLAPSVMAGAGTVNTGGLAIQIEAPALPAGSSLIAALFSQDRPPDPTRRQR